MYKLRTEQNPFLLAMRDMDSSIFKAKVRVYTATVAEVATASAGLLSLGLADAKGMKAALLYGGASILSELVRRKSKSNLSTETLKKEKLSSQIDDYLNRDSPC